MFSSVHFCIASRPIKKLGFTPIAIDAMVNDRLFTPFRYVCSLSKHFCFGISLLLPSNNSTYIIIAFLGRCRRNAFGFQAKLADVNTGRCSTTSPM